MRRALDLALRHARWSALALGALSALGFQPTGLWPLALLGIAGLIELTMRAATARAAALAGWLFGLGHFTIGNTWIATAFTYQTAMPPWLGWIAVVLLALVLAVFPALACWSAWQLGRTRPAALVAGFAGCWIIAEWLRSWVFTGFPWNPLGVVLLGPFARPGLAGAAAPWLGTYGLSGLAVLLAGSWLLALRRGRADWPAGALALVPAALMLWPAPAPVPAGTRAFTLVQPDIPQNQLNDPATFEAQFVRLARLSLPRDAARRRLVLWPESGVPDYLREGYPPQYYLDTWAGDPALARQRLGRVIGPESLLLTGTVDLEIAGGRAVGARNAMTAIDGKGTIRGAYAKAHLVPFGEYLPLRALLMPLGLARLVPGDIEFWPGPGPRTLDLGKWGRAGIQICYEIVFSGRVTDRVHRGEFIFNPSNDGWFGAWGPPQHLAQARLRAIEEGLPVLRATTTGISAVIDARGVVQQYIPRNAAGRIDGTVPPAAAPTLFARLGNMLPLGLAALLLALSLVATRRARG